MIATKSQIKYLETRMCAIVRDKITEWEKKNKAPDSQLLMDMIKAGDCVMYDEPKNSYMNISSFFDITPWEMVCDEYNLLKKDYRSKLEKKTAEIMDSVVLGDLNISEALAELEKI